MNQATQRSLADVLKIAVLQTVVQVERASRASDNARIRAVVNRAA
jgi:hypothetical protein